jgi:drug/metabolite transporter (DMT)-like permease
MTLPPLVAAAVLLSALLHASWNALVKTSGDPMLAQAIIMVGTGSFGCLLISQTSFPWEAWPWLLASTLVHSIYLLALVRSYSVGDLSQVYPIARGSAPMLIAILAFPLLGESLSVQDCLGILMISGGIFLLATGGLVRNRKAILWSLLTGLLIVGYSLLDGIGVRASESPFGYVGWLALGEALPIAVYACWTRRRVLQTNLRQNGIVWFCGGILAAIGYTIILWAYDQAEMAPVAALRETSVVMAAIIGAWKFGEPLGARRILASCIVVIGAALLNT